MEGSRGRISDRNSKARAVEERCLRLLPGSGILTAQDYRLGNNSAARGGQGPPTSIKNQDNSPQTSSQAVLTWALLPLRVSGQIDS